MDSLPNFIREIPRFLLLIAVVFVVIGFSIAAPSFVSVNNFLNIIRQASIVGMMGLGLTAAIAVGEFDFSIGATATISAVAAGMVLSTGAVNSTCIAFIIGLLVAVTIGLINSFNVLKIGMPSFIATLGFSTLLTGLAKYFTGGAVFYSTQWPESFGVLGKGAVLQGVIPISAIVFVVIAILGWLFLHRSIIGRYIYAVGNNPTAATSVGIKTSEIKLVAFVFSSFLCGFAGIIQGSMLGSISPLMGSGNLLPAITTAMLGATFLTPGTPNIPGTFLAAFLMATIQNGLTMIGASFYMKGVVTGLILLTAIGMISLSKEGKLGQMVTGL